MPFCTSCGHENQDHFRYCAACGKSIHELTRQPTERQQLGQSRTNALRTTTMVIGLVTAVLLLLGGCAGYVTGGIFEAAEEALEVEFDEPGQHTSTTEDVELAGGLAMLVSFLLFLGAGLARVATRVSLVLLTAAMPILTVLVAIDTTSLFAFVYYLTILMVGTCVVLMTIACLRMRNV